MAIEQQITTPEGAEIVLDLGGVGSRSIAVMIDHALQGLLLLLLTFASGFILEAWRSLVSSLRSNSLAWQVFAEFMDLLSQYAMAFAVLAGFLLFWGYFTFFEAFMDGRTPGKRWCKLRVRSESGGPAGFTAIALRNFLRLVDFLPGFYGVGLLTMIVHPQQKRLGDLVAGTLVIKDHPVAGRLWTSSSENSSQQDSPAEWLPHLDRLSTEDHELLRRFAARHQELPPEGRKALAEKLAQEFSHKLELPLPDDPERLLQNLLGQYEARRRSAT